MTRMHLLEPPCCASLKCDRKMHYNALAFGGEDEF